VACSESDTTGFYEFSSLPAGVYKLWVDVAGFPMIQTYYGLHVTSSDTLLTGLNFFIDTADATAGIYIDNTYGVQNFETTGFSVELYPNPVKAEFSIIYSLDVPGKVNIEIMDISGRSIIVIPAGDMIPAGNYRNVFNSEILGLVPGTYILNFTVGKNVYLKKFVVQ
jgi:hypothetical protein